ncbi:hypothetical protein PR048_032134 [Dryococelus australis]|uniref:Uncharacterized protein n=1 Tax=Dryococelus australis TaxID=614101 RepID=A0ABQ9G460_9NEOP|nr:hypothetical protein PR048_032134 [Dryococelus australis]
MPNSNSNLHVPSHSRSHDYPTRLEEIFPVATHCFHAAINSLTTLHPLQVGCSAISPAPPPPLQGTFAVSQPHRVSYTYLPAYEPVQHKHSATLLHAGSASFTSRISLFFSFVGPLWLSGYSARRARPQPPSSPDFRKWESCLTMPLLFRIPPRRTGFNRRPDHSRVLVSGKPATDRRVFSGKYRFSAFRRRSVLTSFHPHRLPRPAQISHLSTQLYCVGNILELIYPHLSDVYTIVYTGRGSEQYPHLSDVYTIVYTGRGSEQYPHLSDVYTIVYTGRGSEQYPHLSDVYTIVYTGRGSELYPHLSDVYTIVYTGRGSEQYPHLSDVYTIVTLDVELYPHLSDVYTIVYTGRGSEQYPHLSDVYTIVYTGRGSEQYPHLSNVYTIVYTGRGSEQYPHLSDVYTIVYTGRGSEQYPHLSDVYTIVYTGRGGEQYPHLSDVYTIVYTGRDVYTIVYTGRGSEQYPHLSDVYTIVYTGRGSEQYPHLSDVYTIVYTGRGSEQYPHLSDVYTIVYTGRGSEQYPHLSDVYTIVYTGRGSEQYPHLSDVYTIVYTGRGGEQYPHLSDVYTIVYTGRGSEQYPHLSNVYTIVYTGRGIRRNSVPIPFVWPYSFSDWLRTPCEQCDWPLSAVGGSLSAGLANDAAAECKGEVNGRSPRKPADQRHRPARSPHAKIRERGCSRIFAGFAYVEGEYSNYYVTAAPYKSLTNTGLLYTNNMSERVNGSSSEPSGLSAGNERAWEAGDPRENPPTSGIIRTIPTCESPVARPGIETGSPRCEASTLTAQSPRPPETIKHGLNLLL